MATSVPSATSANLLENAIVALGTVIADYDDHQQKAEALLLRPEFKNAIDPREPRLSELMDLLGRDPPRARTIAKDILARVTPSS